MPTENSERRIVYLQRKKDGCCPRCGNKKRKTEKFSYCDECREFFRSYQKGIAREENEVRKERYDQRKRNNQCPRCGIKLGKRYPNIICTECLEKQYGYNTAKTARR